MAQLFSSGGVVAEDAIDHGWRMWTEDLDDESRQCLVRWRGEAELSAAVFAMAMNPRTLREPVLAFCRRHGLVPVRTRSSWTSPRERGPRGARLAVAAPNR